MRQVFRLGGGRRHSTVSDKSLARALVKHADTARDQRRFRQAAALYEEAIKLGAAGAGVRVQAGHMFKEAGELETAEQHYMDAARLMPDDADLALQLGHFFKVAGRLREAQRQYARALRLRPEWELATRELAHLRESGFGIQEGGDQQPLVPIGFDLEKDASEIARAALYADLVPEIMPLDPAQFLHRNGESIHLRRLGRLERTFWGVQSTLRGVEAVRGFCISSDPIVELQILLNGLVMHRGPTRSYPLKQELENRKLRKYIFNVWIDLQGFLPGRYGLELRFKDTSDTRDEIGGRRSHRQDIVVAEPLPEPKFEGGDAWTPLTDPDDPRSVEEQVNARPSVISPARRTIFKTPIRNILVLRTDQLGDLVVSIPALRRLRAMFPGANIVGLLTSANADLARTLDLLNEIIVIDFPDEKVIQRKRVMTSEDQEALRARLAPFKFDLALDLAPAVESRPLLLLSGASFLAGMRDKTWPYINAGFDLNTYDPVGRSDIMPASSKTAAFIESLGIMMKSPAEVVRRPDLTRDRLLPFGITASDSYVIIHTGARVVFSRWAHYMSLAERVLQRTSHKVVMLSEDAETRAQLTPRLTENERFQLLDERLAFDDFDALLSYCACFVGNDSGPKHLASLRGSNVVSLHTARINWGEWGQEQTGSIIHRQVPCAGCHIYHDPEECGKDYVCVTQISIDEVWGAMEPFL